MTEPTAAGLPHRVTGMRRYVLWSMWALPLFIFAPAVIDLVSNDHGAVRLVAYPLLMVALAVQRIRLVPRAMDDEPRSRLPVQLAVAFLLAGACYLDMIVHSEFGGFWSALPATVLGLSGSVVGARLRTPVLYSGSILILGGGLLIDAALDGRTPLGEIILLGGLFSAMLVFADVTSIWLWKVVCELDRARATAATLAVTEERLRIAADLHDIQGNHLQAIALKGELAERLIGQNDEAARQQAAEIAELARTALSDTRALVQGYRKTSLDIEINNAVGILDAAGIEVTVHGAVDEVPAKLRPLFGALFREGTTNLLRHSNASTARLGIEVAGDRVTARMCNDGVDSSAAGSTDGSGLAGLRERFTAIGGRVEARTRDGEFELTASAATNGGAR